MLNQIVKLINIRSNMMFAYLSIFKIMGGLFYTGETNSKKARINFAIHLLD